jgi:polysaccharide pyruvyl transferase WcaK-like protein
MTEQFTVAAQPNSPESPSSVNSNLERPHIAVLGTFGVGNLGNECTLQATLSNIRRFLPAAEVTCICSDPQEAAADYGIHAFPIRYVLPDRTFRAYAHSTHILAKGLRKLVRFSTAPYRWYKAFKILKSQDALLIIGLGMLGDFGISAFGLHYDILGWCLVAKLCRCKLEFVSVGVGPIRDRLSRLFVKTALALGDYRSYRDTFSKEYLEGIGFSTTNDHVYPDLAFSLPKLKLPANPQGESRSRVIGVGLIPYYGRRGRLEGGDDRIYRKYVASVSGLICMLIDRGYAIRLLIGDARYDHEIRYDIRTSLAARGQQYLGTGLIDEPASSVAELLSQLATTDLVIASRFHNVLLSIMLGKPVVALSYHEKVASLMKEFRLSDFCHDIEEFDSDKLIGQLLTLEAGKACATGRTSIEQQAEDYRKALNEQYERIFRPFLTNIPQP